ncbi:velvet factor-domain-containing protein [Cokeromyces recurvatus]|uniref:velvet factor-domain-containing protein n=1 Tax=Cokeromyces recurvatus TaxID=90255 RepID=UPI00221FF229|nr:velvet factor-domain-containing protein [Cokeromyces recurvatus]KAI7905628.1 velvet factor-domain-containing protein [Cokeromyces recurvatus]
MSSTHNNSHSSGCTYRFIESSLATLPSTINYDLEIRQQPNRAKLSVINERDRRPIEPPPILQLHWKNCTENELKKCLQSPFYFTVANLVTEDDPETPLLPIQNYLSGSTVSSLYRLRDIDNSDGGFFVFGDLAVKKEGRFKLRFSLFEIVEGEVRNRKTILSDTFTVYIPKQFPGPTEATFLSRTFSDQGVKMRIRKEHRLQSRKRKIEQTHDSISSESSYPVKKYQPKDSKLIVSSPSYAEHSSSSSTTTSSDVLFGRWQAMAHSDRHISDQQSRVPLSPQHKNKDHYLKHTFQSSDDPTYAFPSPESTIYHHTSSSNTTPITRSMSVAYSSYPSLSSSSYTKQSHVPRNSWPTISYSTTSSFSSTSTPSSTSSTSPVLIAANHLTDSPPLMARELPADLSLARYHTCSDRHKYQTRSTVDRLPTPPISITELHHLATGTQGWGTRLPPLRAIMNQLDRKKPSFPLILPPPTVVPLGQSNHSLYEQTSHYHPYY